MAPTPAPYALQTDFFGWREWKLSIDIIPQQWQDLSSYFKNKNDQTIEEAKRILGLDNYYELAVSESIGGNLFLRSSMAGSSTVWDNPVIKATCIKKKEEQKHPLNDMDAPSYNCDCGIYAYSTLEDFIMPSFAGFISGPIWGCMRAWGKIVFSHFGFRCQYATPAYLFVNPDYCGESSDWVAEQLASQYEAPVKVARLTEIFDAIIKGKHLDYDYPAISPPIQLGAATMPYAEMAADSIDWQAIAQKQAHRKIVHPAHKKESTHGQDR